MKKWFTNLLSTALLVSATAFAGDAPDTSVATEVQQLKLRLQELEQRLAEKQDAATTVTVANQKAVSVNEDTTKDVRGFALLKDALSEVSIGGNVDVVGYYADGSTGLAGVAGVKEDTSEIFIDQVRLNVQVDVNDYVKGFVGLQFEDYQIGSYANGVLGDTETDGDLQVDEAHITISGEEGLYAIAGKQYFSFGNATEYGNFINDTLARQLYETRDTGITAGYKAVGVDINLFAFNGAFEEVRSSGTDNKIDTWGGSASYSMGDEERSLKLGVSYIDNILQAQNPTRVTGLDLATLAFPFPTAVLDDDSGGINGYIVASMGPFWLSGEYVAAINDLDPADVPPGARKDQRPEAYTIEAAFTTPLADRDYTLAVKWEENNDQDAFDNEVQSVWGVGASTEIFENTRLTLNWENWQFEESVLAGRADLYLAEVSVKF